MKRILMACSILAFMAITAYAGDPPKFFKDAYPEQALQAAWEEYQAVYSPDSAVSPKVKQLIALGVSTQIPCEYCIYVHTMKAKQAGATDAKIKEALAVAAMTRGGIPCLTARHTAWRSSKPKWVGEYVTTTLPSRSTTSVSAFRLGGLEKVKVS